MIETIGDGSVGTRSTGEDSSLSGTAAAGVPVRPRIALAHDWLVGLRGGEQVLDRCARLFGPTDLYTLVRDERRALTPAIDACRVVVSPLQVIPGARDRWRRHMIPLMPWAVGRLEVAPCDLLLSTSSAVMKSIRPPDGVPHLCYCHTPARYFWGQREAYAGGDGGRLRTIGLAAMGPWFRRWDRRTADRVTRFLANSTHTRDRIRAAFGRDADVVHPPVRTSFFTPDGRAPEDFWLVVSALEPYKRVDLAVAAAGARRERLLVVGDGSQRRHLERMAGPTVTFLGRVPDDALRDVYRRARALLFPQVEDFGIIAVEAMACGCPVIANAEGGSRDIVEDGSSGLLFDQQTVDSLAAAMGRCLQSTPTTAACRARAERFSESRFDAAILAHVRDLLESCGR